MSGRDADKRFHAEWLGLAQPIEGLVFSVPALADAQIAPKVRTSITAELDEELVDTPSGPALADVQVFFERFLGYSQPGALVDRSALPQELSFYAPEGRQEIRPSFAVARQPAPVIDDDDPFAAFEKPAEGTTSGDGETSPYLALVWDLSSEAGDDALALDLDAPEDVTGLWRYPPTAKLERLLRHTGVPIGFLSNRRELRLVYAPAGEATAHLTFRFEQLRQRAGRPLVAALDLLFNAKRTYEAAPEYTFAGLLQESRQRQADVTDKLAKQVFEAVEILLRGFEEAAGRDCTSDRLDWLRAALEEPGDHLYQGILAVVLRLVFILYAEDQSLVPVQHSTYANHLSVLGLYERLADDAGSHPESIHLRFGAYGRLIALFRAVFLGVEHGDPEEDGLRLPPRRGRLFDPSAYPFLEGGLPDWTAAITLPEERARVELPSIDDDTVYRVLHRLVVFEGQRLSYRTLDVEQIGAVYESLMGYRVLRVQSPAVRLGKNRVWVETEAVQGMKPRDRKKLWKDTCGLGTSARRKAEEAAKGKASAETLAEALTELSPGKKADVRRHRAATGGLVLQPGEERRRTGSHYTPRWLSEKVVSRTLEPILACLGEDRTAEQILELKICDPAMGSGAFLVATCRLLAEEVVAAWDRSGELPALTEEHGDGLLHARRLVAQRCLYGVDKNAAAVELAKLSLWLVTLSKELPFTFVDHALRHGDSLVGLDLEQIRSFHWHPEEQVPMCRSLLDDALEQALGYREQILGLAVREDAASQREKQRLLEYAEQATERVRVIADACVGAFLAEKKKGRSGERNRRLQLVERMLQGDEEASAEVGALAERTRTQHAPFHWHLEFPEIFHLERPDPLEAGEVNRAAFMEAFVGNPPFMNGKHVSGRLGDSYRDFLLDAYRPARGGADLCSFFVRRAADLVGPHGCLGFITTKTIAEGETRESALAHLLREGWTIYSAERPSEWAGQAAVVVTPFALGIGSPATAASPRFAGDRVAIINSRLRPAPERDDPPDLVSNHSLFSQGVNLGGNGFVLTPDEREQLLREEPTSSSIVRPYVGGSDFGQSPPSRVVDVDRWVIDFTGFELDRAKRQHPIALSIVEERVRAVRVEARDTAISRRMKKYWWLYWAPRTDFFGHARTMDRLFVVPQTSKYPVFAEMPSHFVPSQTLYVVACDAWSGWAALQSRAHGLWASLLSTAMKSDFRYTPSRCLANFPFPAADPLTRHESVEEVATVVYDKRASYMERIEGGLTQVYNALLDERLQDDAEVLELRALHEQMDRAVLDAYGWSDIEVPPFCPRSDTERATLEGFEDEVIDRLYLLNAARVREEERLGLRKTPKKGRAKKRTTKRTKKPATDSVTGRQQTLDLNDS